jgi:hypothetical protein
MSSPRAFTARQLTADQCMRGHCHSLALELHTRTGLPLAGCYWERARRSHDKPTPNHVFIVLPDGRGLDALGPHERADHPNTARRPDWQPMTADDVRLLVDYDYCRPDLAGVQDVAGRLLRALPVALQQR